MPTKKKFTKKPIRTTKVSRKLKKQHPKHFLKVYWPYIPILLVVTFGMLFGGVLPQTRTSQTATLAYSTEMSAGALLVNTNAERTSRGLAPLKLNSKLNSSATAKANDMVNKDYWAHNTPSGQEPWIFFDAAGYNYKKAGENLAYGFVTSNETIVGWMNSPTHRDNMLDASYAEVGFGFKNSSNFVGTGEETIVVAHYGTALGASTPAASPTPAAPAATPQSLPASSSPAPVVEEPEPEPEPEPQPVDPSRINQPITSDNPVPDEVNPTSITRLQQLTNGDAPWSAIALSSLAFGVVIIWLIKHAILVKRFVFYGEHFVAHHPMLDLAVVSIAAVAVYLSQSSGVVL